MKRFLCTLALVTGSVLAASLPQAAQAQYGLYGNYTGGGHNFVPHVRSFSTNGYYQPISGYGGYGYGGGYGGYGGGYGGQCGRGYGYGPYGNVPYGYGPYNAYRGFSGGGISIRW
jgi:hypothetical protein